VILHVRGSWFDAEPCPCRTGFARMKEKRERKESRVMRNFISFYCDFYLRAIIESSDDDGEEYRGIVEVNRSGIYT
jgi:hypothetical protein